jgi:peroxiredoxin
MVLAAVFLTAGVAKLFDLQGSRQAMRDFGVPARLSGAGGLLLPIAEIAAAVALIFVPSARWGAAGAFVLLFGFTAGIANALRHGIAPDCHCFGQIHSAPAGRGTLIRNAGLAAIAAFAVIKAPGPALDSWVAARSAAELVAVGLGVAAGVLALFAAQLWVEARHLRRDLGSAQRMAAGAPPGLPVGVPAPEFALQSVDGETVTLEGLRERRLPILLVFASPWCSSCLDLFPNLRRWQQTLAQRLTITLISSGTVKDNQLLFREHGLENVLLQEQSELIESYRIRGTPTAVLVNVDGTIGSIPAESVFGIEPMVRLVLRDESASAPPELESSRA